MAEAKIPEDLQQLYRDCLTMFIDYVSLATAQKLIERIAALEAQLAEAQGTIARLLSGAELDEICAQLGPPHYQRTEDGEAWYWAFDSEFPVADNLSELFFAARQLLAARLAPPQDALQEKP